MSLERKIRSISTKHRQALREGLLEAAITLQALSQDVVPVDEGNLKSSAYTEDKSTNPDSPEIVVAYSDPKAIIVHEDLSKAHGRQFNVKHADAIARGTVKARGVNQRAKFLERPARENSKLLASIIRRRIKDVKPDK